MRKRLFCGIIGFVGVLAFSFFSVHSAIAAKIAVFGDNSIDNFLAAQGNTVALVDMTLLEKPLNEQGSLNDYDVFIYTRKWSTYGEGLSLTAAANVKSFVTGNVVLFMSDMADMIGSSEHLAQAVDINQYAEKALLNAVAFASANGKGYIGEFNGAALALSSNTSGDYGGLALGLVQGTFTGLKRYPLSNSDLDVLAPDHPVVAGLPDPWNMMGGLEYVYTSQISDPSYLVVASWTEGLGGAQFPAIIASPAPSEIVGVMEPASFFSLLGGLAGLSSISRRKSPQKGPAARS
jgi:hypothetical protein